MSIGEIRSIAFESWCWVNRFPNTIFNSYYTAQQAFF